MAGDLSCIVAGYDGSVASKSALEHAAHDADEIVVGSRGFGPVRGALGSVAYRVLHHAERTAVVVPERPV